MTDTGTVTEATSSTDEVAPEYQHDEDVVDAELVDDAPVEDDESVVEDEPQLPETDVVEETPTPRKRGGRKAKADKAAEGENLPAVPDVVDAELVESASEDEDKSAFSRSEARRLTAKLKTGLRNAAEFVMQAYDGRIWLALGYDSWTDYLDSELGEYRVKLPAIERKQLVEKMSTPKKEGGPGMSSRAIAAALGVDQKTVVNDRKAIGAGEEDSSAVKVDSERGEGRVTGQDGKSYPERGKSKAREVDLADRFTQQLVPADAALGELLAYTTDERWEEFAGQVATRHRGDLARMAKTLSEIIKAIPGMS